MSDFAYFRFLSYNLLTEEEKKDKEEIIAITEEVLDTKGIECDATISRISEDNIKEILEDVRQIRKKKKRKDKAVDVSIEKQIEC
jgi:predicted Zn-ribbon and HTH transcriptional regulator